MLEERKEKKRKGKKSSPPPPSRFNGMLGVYSTSHRCIEIEILRKFSRTAILNSLELEGLSPEFSSFFQPLRDRPTKGSRLAKESSEKVLEIYFESLSPFTKFKGNEAYGEAIKPYFKTVLTLAGFQQLKAVYTLAYVWCLSSYRQRNSQTQSIPSRRGRILLLELWFSSEILCISRWFSGWIGKMLPSANLFALPALHLLCKGAHICSSSLF